MASRLLAVPAALLFSLASYPCLAADGTRWSWVERGQILPEHVTVKFKLDTGALTSSMHAEDLDYFERTATSGSASIWTSRTWSRTSWSSLASSASCSAS